MTQAVGKIALSLTMLLASLLAGNVYAALTIEITKGVDAGIPIAVVPFEWKSSSPPPQFVADIIESDLVRSGRFESIPRKDFLAAPHDHDEVKYKNWRLLKTEALVVGRINVLEPDKFEVRFQLLDVYKEKQLAGYQFVIDTSKMRKVAHQISDIIYEALTGKPGAFDTRVAYVTVQKTASEGNRHLLLVADSDGYAPRQILSSTDSIMSPAWAPNGSQLAYVSFEGGRSMIFVQDVFTGKRRRVASFEGLNSAPAWSPDGSQMAMTLSRDGNSEIYIMQMASSKLRRVTNHLAIDTEPAWSPDGKSLVFTSGRAGRPQIYQVPAAGGKATRLTFEGIYNARPSFSPDGDRLVLVTNQGNGYQIGVFYLDTRSTQVLTDSRLDESPTFAPNGDMILYASQVSGRGVLAAVSVDGRVKQRLELIGGTVREPAWSPFNQKLK
ncbi:MAG: TolB protein [Gammaproteobacteria bacterium]|jgi:TolB protein